jgi:hypothetical protein
MEDACCTCVSKNGYICYSEKTIIPKSKKLCNNLEYVFGVKNNNNELFSYRLKDNLRTLEKKINFKVDLIFCSEKNVFVLEKIGLKTSGESKTEINIFDVNFNTINKSHIDGVCTSFLSDNGVFFIGSSYGYIYCIDYNGKQLWKTKIPERKCEHQLSNFYGKVAPYNVKISNNKIVCTSYENIYVLNNDGNIIWSWSVPSECEQSNSFTVDDIPVKIGFGSLENIGLPIAIIRGATINNAGVVRCVYKNVFFEITNGTTINQVKFNLDENFCNIYSDEMLDIVAIESRKRVYEKWQYTKYGQDFSEVILFENKREKARLVSPFQSNIEVNSKFKRVFVWNKNTFIIFNFNGECLLELNFKYEISNVNSCIDGKITICAGNFYIVDSIGDVSSVR